MFKTTTTNSLQTHTIFVSFLKRETNVINIDNVFFFFFFNIKEYVFVCSWDDSDERQLKINNLDFSASGYYSCSASMEQPIYTKFSEKVKLTVFEKQHGDPQITLRKAAYAVGEVLELNCTSEPARPSPAVTWLLNSKELRKPIKMTEEKKSVHRYITTILLK
ncbi:beat protein, putative [Pediculus humanus corporis]|uniref:Beat protein, putative n=1 Tax=Pediculus humanus subsp. corporis TaxID=121224 RepID=E0W012_PEDHC|nr:beat protein, putative [Pediculus humanus corporis]EEB18968.1 beat protein, putative [Pediculus humanus corporis]